MRKEALNGKSLKMGGGNRFKLRGFFFDAARSAGENKSVKP